jgi:hypothetical protein
MNRPDSIYKLGFPRSGGLLWKARHPFDHMFGLSGNSGNSLANHRAAETLDLIAGVKTHLCGQHPVAEGWLLIRCRMKGFTGHAGFQQTGRVT